MSRRLMAIAVLGRGLAQWTGWLAFGIPAAIVCGALGSRLSVNAFDRALRRLA